MCVLLARRRRRLDEAVFSFPGNRETDSPDKTRTEDWSRRFQLNEMWRLMTGGVGGFGLWCSFVLIISSDVDWITYWLTFRVNGWIIEKHFMRTILKWNGGVRIKYWIKILITIFVLWGFLFSAVFISINLLTIWKLKALTRIMANCYLPGNGNGNWQ